MCRDSQAEQCHILPGGSRLDTTLAVPVKVDSGTCRAEQCPAEKESQIEEDQAEQSPSNIVKDKPIVCEDQVDVAQAHVDDRPG